ncbi:MAG TPA: alpha/beta fold hydrolase, partial [Pirellulales bacterium]|nr:alpha/beta fold hydrolase [Pirellulales bacterium]
MRVLTGVLAALTYGSDALCDPLPQAVCRPSAPCAMVAAGATAEATLVQAQTLDRSEQARSVDLYFQAAVQATQSFGQDPAFGYVDGRSAEVYRQALSGLIDAGQRYGRLDPRRQLVVVEGGARIVPIHYQGFAWRPQDFSRLTSVVGCESREFAHHYANRGLGLPLIGERIASCQPETFFRPWQPFAVTAVLRPAHDAGTTGQPVCGEGYVLELFNPLAIGSLSWGEVSYPLAGNLTAPLAMTVSKVPRQYLRGFTAPSDTSVQQQLVMMEPYQRGKIPVVFIHGLYSDPITWVDMANELLVHRDLYAHFQFWIFRYPTGGEVLDSAAVLRRDLQAARDTFDPEHTDPALDQIVLVGHSLGGLLSQMQVTRSYDLLWREIANQPFDALRAPPKLQERLAQCFFFEPVPAVKRVVFIGTPHHGSGMTR